MAKKKEQSPGRGRRERKPEPTRAAPQKTSKPSPIGGPVEPAMEGPFRSGCACLVGRPNVGKSTILNRLLGRKIAATTHKPQTTRKNLLGVLHPQGAQILFLDTPGHHLAKGAMNRYMVSESERAIEDADVVAYVVEARAGGNVTPGNERLLEAIRRSAKKVVLLLNKVDRVKDKKAILPQIAGYREVLGEQLSAVVPISAQKGLGLEDAVREIARALPEGPPYYESDEVTDVPERGIIAELIREKVILETREELPYSAAVTVEDMEDRRPHLVRVLATIHVERDSQKGIVIGAKGVRLKAIGTRARKEIETFVGAPVYLKLEVRVLEAWSDDPRAMARLGYTT